MNTQEMMNQITQAIEKNANVKVCFGEPYVKDSLTIIPVAKMKAGGGGGSGSATGSGKKKTEDTINVPEQSSKDNDTPKNSSTATGSGMGIGITTTPVGYIQIKDECAEYKEIVDSERIALFGMITALLSVFFISVSIVRIFKYGLVKSSKKRKNEKTDIL